MKVIVEGVNRTSSPLAYEVKMSIDGLVHFGVLTLDDSAKVWNPDTL